MSIFSSRARTPSEIPKSMPPLPPRGAMPTPAEGDDATTKAASLRRRVLLPPALVGWLPQDLSTNAIQVDEISSEEHDVPTGLVGPLSHDFIADGTQVDFEEQMPYAMNSDNYFTNLLSNGTNPGIASACALFKAEDRQHRNFPYMHCWKILKNKPKWIERRKTSITPKVTNKKQKTSANATSSSAPCTH